MQRASVFDKLGHYVSYMKGSLGSRSADPDETSLRLIPLDPLLRPGSVCGSFLMASKVAYNADSLPRRLSIESPHVITH